MASRTVLETLDAELVQIAGTYAPITVRGAFYQAVSRGLVPKDETKGYRLVQRRLLKLRENLDIPYGWITDGSRTVYGHVRYHDADEFARSVKTRYRQDYWAESDEYVEIWIEKDALAGVVMPVVVEEFGLNLHVTRGYPMGRGAWCWESCGSSGTRRQRRAVRIVTNLARQGDPRWRIQENLQPEAIPFLLCP